MTTGPQRLENSNRTLKAQVGKLNNLLVYLSVLDCGCKEHPSYRAHRRPSASCQTCEKMWEARGLYDVEKMSVVK
jgi:hypothetical protein